MNQRVEISERPTKVGTAITVSAFADFITFGDSQLVKMKRAAIAFADDLLARRSPRWCTLLGASGVGKTHLARAIYSIFRRNLSGEIQFADTGRIRRYSGEFLKWSALANRLREGNYGFFSDMCDVSFAVLDDIGAEHQSDFSRAKLYEFLDRSVGKWRVLTSNLTLEQVAERLDTRVASRMLRNDSVVIEVDTLDYSLRKTRNGRIQPCA
jgi:DNA replication protein DnaC